MDPQKLYQQALASKKENQVLFRRLALMDPRKLDDLAHRLHEATFNKIDCLTCANCCKTLGPRIKDKDITRIAASLKIKPGRFIDLYLIKDEEEDFVFKSMPCPFLGCDNYCSIYEERPKACREYPHTDRRRFYQILPLTLKNSFICPAVMSIIEGIRKGMSKP